MSGSEAGAVHWARIQELFHAALEQPPEDRWHFVADVAGADAGLAAEVGSLLAAHADSGPVPVLETAPPRRLGHYRLGDLLGVGGMGAVYLAQREGPDYTQRVALKLIRAGYLDPRMEERLRSERRILARLEHPGIARLIDGGTTETGQSYLAVEYVEGVTLLEYADRERLSVPDRLRLFLEVADAVHYAHQQLVVHGDLKPANILVTAQGRPRLLDFGIGELLDPELDGEEAHHPIPWLTPEYASPEQIRGLRLTTATDVYALGVVLFELLTGRRPHRLAGLSVTEAERIVCGTPAPAPSSVVTDPALRRALVGDLDAMVLMALAREPEHRYASVGRLAADVRRYLGKWPVHARPARPGYLLGKFVHRNRAAVATVTLVFLSLVGGIAAAAWQAALARRERDRAEESRRQAEEVSGFLVGLYESADPWHSGPDTLAARALLREGLARVEQLDAQPALQARVLDALARIHVTLGRDDDALGLFRRALVIRRARLGERAPDVAESYTNIASVLRRRAKYLEADSLIRQALAIQRESLGKTHPAVARTLLDAAFLSVAMTHLRQAEVEAREALAISRARLEPDHPQTAEATRALASILNRQGRFAESEAAYREYVAIQERRYGPNHPEAAAAKVHLGDLYREGLQRPLTAESLYRSALAVEIAALGPDHLFLAHVRNSLAALLSARGEHAEAVALLRAQLLATTRSLGADHPAVATSMADLSRELLLAGNVEEAADLASRALALHRRILGPDAPAINSSMLALAWVRMKQGRRAEGIQLGRDAAEISRAAYGDSHPLYALTLEALGRLLIEDRQRQEADSVLTKALAIMAPVTPENNPSRRRIATLLGEVRATRP